MSSHAFRSRNCPVCASTSNTAEAYSQRRAETLSMDAVRPYWTGFDKEKVFFSYHRCGSCGLLFAPIFFDDEQLVDLYSQMAPNMDVVPSSALEATQRGYFEAAMAAGPVAGGYLEIGPDIGFIVKHASQGSHFDKYWLFEPNRAVHDQLAAAASGKPHDIRADMSDLSCVPDGSIGLAVMVHVLDHLLDPVAMLAQIRAKLKPGGKLVIVTHNEKSLLRSLMSSKWPPFCLQHPEIYNPLSIAKALSAAGFANVKVDRSKNIFPAAFLIRHAALGFGIKLDKMRLPKFVLGLKLGNIITTAS